MTHKEEAEVVYRQLPAGKHYHIFISYRDSEEDRPWVRELISNLQSRYKFLCCDHATDFEPGKKIIDNIKEAITKSTKTLIILSEGYKDSYWCEFEIEYALWLNMDLKEQILIPVLKEDCEIPDYLKPFTYIDARDNDMDRWLPKLVCAIESKVKNYSHQAPTDNEAFPTGYGNLEILHEEKSNFNCCGPVFQSRYVPHTLQRIGSSLYSDIMNRVALTVTVEGRHCRNIWLPTMIFFIITAVLLGGLGIAMLGVTSNSEQIYNPIAQAGIVLTVLFAVMMFVWIPICCYTHYKVLNC